MPSLLLAVQSVVSIEDRISQPPVPSLWNLWILIIKLVEKGGKAQVAVSSLTLFMIAEY